MREQRGTKRMAAKAWIQQYVSEEEGHAQQKTGDEFQHLQGMKQKQLLEKYEGWHKEESASSGRPPPMCSKSTFNRTMDEMRETRKLRPELEALHCAPTRPRHQGRLHVAFSSPRGHQGSFGSSLFFACDRRTLSDDKK